MKPVREQVDLQVRRQVYQPVRWQVDGQVDLQVWGRVFWRVKWLRVIWQVGEQVKEDIR